MAQDRRKDVPVSSGFFFDVERWFGSVSAQRMSFAEKGVYLVMLFQEWRDRQRSLPDDAAAVAEMIAVTEAQVSEVLAAWPIVRKKFTTCDREQGRIFNAGIERTRRQQAQYRKRRQEAGARGGKAKAAKRSNDDHLRASNATAMLDDATALLSDLNRQDKTRSDLTRTEITGGDFDVFWSAYPRKVAKDEARRAWAKRKPDAALAARMTAAVGAQARSKKWQEGYIPNPATWLNQGRWQDEIEDGKAAVRSWTFDCPHPTHCATSWQCVQRQKQAVAS